MHMAIGNLRQCLSPAGSAQQPEQELSCLSQTLLRQRHSSAPNRATMGAEVPGPIHTLSSCSASPGVRSVGIHTPVISGHWEAESE